MVFPQETGLGVAYATGLTLASTLHISLPCSLFSLGQLKKAQEKVSYMSLR